MFGHVYTFESEKPRTSHNELPIDVAAGRAIEAGINGRTEIRYQELTGHDNPRPMFAVIFADPAQQEAFESLFVPALALCGLRIAAVCALVQGEIEATRKPDLGYIDRERGYALFIPSLPPLAEDPQT
jgi:hypothetical protein